MERDLDIAGRWIINPNYIGEKNILRMPRLKVEKKSKLNQPPHPWNKLVNQVSRSLSLHYKHILRMP